MEIKSTESRSCRWGGSGPSPQGREELTASQRLPRLPGETLSPKAGGAKKGGRGGVKEEGGRREGKGGRGERKRRRRKRRKRTRRGRRGKRRERWRKEREVEEEEREVEEEEDRNEKEQLARDGAHGARTHPVAGRRRSRHTSGVEEKTEERLGEISESKYGEKSVGTVREHQRVVVTALCPTPAPACDLVPGEEGGVRGRRV